MKNQTPTNVIVVIGAGSLGQAIARRVSAGKHVFRKAMDENRPSPLSNERADTTVRFLSPLHS